jgi:hypothetical protein
MSSFPFGVQYYKEPEIAAVRNHSIFYLLFENYTEEQLAENGNLTVNLIRTSNIYEIYANTETLIYLFYKNVATNPAYIKLFKTLIQILIITSYIINTPYLLSSTYVFDKNNGEIDPDNSDIEDITNILLGDKQFGYSKVYDFVDYLFSQVHMSVEYGILGGYFSQNIKETLHIYQQFLPQISVFVDNFYTLLFPEGNETVVVGMLYNHLSNIFNYTFTQEKETEEEEEEERKREQERKDLFIQYMMYILVGNEQILPWYLSALEADNNKNILKSQQEAVLNPTPVTQFVNYGEAYNWFSFKMKETTSEPNLWNPVTTTEFSTKLQQNFGQLQNQQSHMPTALFQKLETEYEQITTSFQIIRRLGMLLSTRQDILTYVTGTLRFNTSELEGLVRALDTVNIDTILHYGKQFLPLLNKIEEDNKEREDAPGNEIIAYYTPIDNKNTENEELVIQQFVAATAPRGGKNIKTKPKKNKKTKKQYKKIIKKQSTKMIKKQHKKNKKTTRKTNNKK